MKQLLVSVVAVFLLLCGCKKETATGTTDFPQKQTDYLLSVETKLKDSLSPADYSNINFNKAFESIDSVKHKYYLRLGINDKQISTDFVLLQTDSVGNILKGRFIHIAKDSSGNGNPGKKFNGVLTLTALNHQANTTEQIIQGKTTITDKAVEPVGTQELAPVVVTTYVKGGFDISDWYLLSDMIGDSGSDGYYMYSAASPSSGGGGASPSATIEVDFEAPENKDAIQIKKYIDCFGSKQTASATYTVTIAVDLPVDNDPGAFFNWSDASPGHTFIELYKNDNSGLVQQNFGFYPNTSWKTVAGPDNIASKIVDDAGHEYQAKYTISVTATQFQQALQAAQNYSNFNYNIATFNCADYALGVFNAAGGGLAVQKFQIPGFPSNNGSNTPQGVYDAIQGLVQAGKLNAAANSQKQWAGDSHGACD